MCGKIADSTHCMSDNLDVSRTGVINLRPSEGRCAVMIEI